MSEYHQPVLLHESLDQLALRPDGVYVDVTFGGGGHSRALLDRLGRRGRLLAFDQDADALENAPDDPRIVLIHNNFRFLRSCVRAAGFDHVDGILADLGVSSHHFDTPSRGFSFRFDGPLDMRMNQHGSSKTAAELLNTYDPARLATLFGRYGELDKCYRIANAIVRYRETAGPFARIDDLLRATDERLAALYAARSGGDAEHYAALMAENNGNGRWLSPEEAFERIVLKYRLGDDTRQIAYLQALHEQIIAFTAGRVADIRRSHGDNLFDVTWRGDAAALENAVRGRCELLDRTDDGSAYRTARIRIDRNDGVRGVLAALNEAVEIRSFSEVIPSMNDIFIRAVNGTL